MTTTEVYALLDDASPDGATRSPSRLYTGHAATLVCRDYAQWPQLLADMQAALARGLYAVTVLSYELGAHLQGIAPGDHRRAPHDAADARQAHGQDVREGAQKEDAREELTHEHSRGRGASSVPLARVLVFERCQLLLAHEVGEWLAARSFPMKQPAGIARIEANVDQAEFTAALARIHDYIETGDTYQINYTYR